MTTHTAALLKATQDALIARDRRQRDALTKAAAQFREYERLHYAKGMPEGDRKAKVNRDMAIMCEGALKA